MCASCGAGTEPGATGGVTRRAAGYGFGDDDQYGVRVGFEGRGAGGAGGDGWRCRSCGGWGDGVDVQRTVSAAAGTEGIPYGRLSRGGFDGERWVVVRL